MSIIEDQVCEVIQSRAAVGLKKYGVSLETAGLTELELLQHAMEESLDFSLYLKTLINEKTKNSQAGKEGFQGESSQRGGQVCLPENKNHGHDETGKAMTKLNAIKKHVNAKLPTYATEGAACFDFYHADCRVRIEPGETAVLRTGIAVEIPLGMVLEIYSRSGHGFRSDISLSNSVGVIDSDYRGEIMVKLRNDGTSEFIVDYGDRIAQGMVKRYERCEISFVEQLSETERGEGGLGSTGA